MPDTPYRLDRQQAGSYKSSAGFKTFEHKQKRPDQ
jgi:hypothetical protein